MQVLEAERGKMGVLNISQQEKDALKAVDVQELRQLIDQAIEDERVSIPYRLLAGCGAHVSTCLRIFGEALVGYSQSKAPRKREETRARARRAGDDLYYAVQNMKHRMETEEQEGLLFVVDDHIYTPLHFSKHLTVNVSYRWRRSASDEWLHGSITFSHTFAERPDYTAPVPKRKPSAAKQEQAQQERLYQEWEHLMRGALYSVRDFLRSGGDGSAIPKKFQVKTDHLGRLNNHSTDFTR